MTDWRAGYTADIGYTYGYYSELNPLRLQLVLLAAGLVPPQNGTACELGFGQGISVNIHAAASATRWFGNDFDPAQAAFAQELAAASGAGAVLSDESFEQFCHRPDLPDFDYICLHGIWSWISDHNRAVIVDFLRRKLKVGGVVYISYNTQAGWAAMTPMRDLMAEHGRTMSAPGQPLAGRVDGALDFIERMAAIQPRYLLANPLLAERLARLRQLDSTYLAHEYFNQHWQPMSFSATALMLESAKLTFAVSALYTDHIEMLNLTPEHQQFLSGIADANFRQTTRDFLVNQQFRQDYWVKGARRLSEIEQMAALRQLRFLLAMPRENIVMTVQGALGTAAMDPAVYGALLDVLQDHRIHSIAELEQDLRGSQLDFRMLLQAIVILASKGCLLAVQDDELIKKAWGPSEKLNRYLIGKALVRSDLTTLASPVTGGGFVVLHLQQLFLLAKDQGRQTPEQWSLFAWQALSAMKQTMVVDGVVLSTEQENLAEIRSHAQYFSDTVLPVLGALGIAA
ncbi:methyltransferase regulatory domain-containing protein [Janthinobacterium agaricidamnosum]|uniref:Methyltransferase domain protein n=1 Tax=Janthinobacterium agaricidamnosum NBRC 102515 = DSM 9628 TaxID=1349767 RepID=W0V1F5_9BURK|nr:methyltransferase regulatory domain-containing protein [Janthinobacterium agaricidamnosum]CDG81173.1 methyltransferase domain protein [Janthinobacterium agaricidamnosum NBRC 102515 = DSM 9628]